MTSTFQAVVFRILPLSVMLGAAVVGAAAGPAFTERIAAVPWLVSLLVVGLPHGAADLAVARRLGRPSAARAFAAYLAGIVAVLGLFAAAPVPLIVLFATLSIWHFGMGHADGQAPPPGCGLVDRGCAALGRGALVLGVPLAVWPDATATVVQRLVELVGGPGQIALARSVFVPGPIHRVGIGIIAAGVAALGVEAWRSRRSPAALHRLRATVVDLAVVTLLGVATHPLFAVGVYFLVWHAWRHLAVLAPVVAGVEPHDGRSLWAALVRLHTAALPLLIPTWVVMLVAWDRLSPDHSWRDLAILSLAVYLVVTPSHDRLVDLLRLHADPPAAPEPSAVRTSCAARLACEPT